MARAKKVPVPDLADVLNVYFKYVVREFYPGDDAVEKRIRGFVVNLQREDATDEQIYDALAEMNEMMGDPMAYYEEFIEGIDNNHKAAVDAAMKAEKAAEQARKHAEKEFTNKRKCVELERETLSKQSKASSTTTANVTLASLNRRVLCPGSYVRIAPDLSTGKCSHGGTGFVTAIDGQGMRQTFTVKYDESSLGSGKTESNISYGRLSEIPFPLFAARTERKRFAPDNFAKENVPPLHSAEPKPVGIGTVLQQGYSKGRGKGWRAKDLHVHTTTTRNHSEQFITLLREDTRELEGVLSVSSSNKYNVTGRDGRFKKRKSDFNPLSITYLAHAWGVGKNFRAKLLKRQSDDSMHSVSPSKPEQHEHYLPVIDSFVSAQVRYNPRNLYIQQRIRERKAEEEVVAYDNLKRKQEYIYREEAKADWALLGNDEQAYWQFQSRSKLEEQPYIADRIIESLRANPTKSFDKVAEDIGHWCSASAIKRWIKTKSGYQTYMQRTLPLLTTEQKKRHVNFATHLRNNWGLPRQKVLWIHYDEKWFYGWVNRSNAKMCEVLGLERSHTYIYHKCHIEKVMAVAFTAFAFDQNIENGGHGIKLGLYRVQAARIAKRDVKESRRDEDGKIHYDGEIIRYKGDAYLVDCNVTGSDQGSSDKPKFSLMALFRDHVFPEIAALVAPGGAYEGYLPVIQGDNAGPHTDATYIGFVTNYCTEKGWKWEPQAPQMPHMNNLDLAVFPMMSKRHSQLLKEYSGKMAPKEDIWEKASIVWSQMGSPEIARGFILAYRIAAKVIDNKGENTFLQTHDFHSDVRKDFYESPTGVKKRARVVH